MTTCQCDACKEAAALLSQTTPVIRMIITLFRDNGVLPDREVELLDKISEYVAKFGGGK